MNPRKVISLLLLLSLGLGRLGNAYAQETSNADQPFSLFLPLVASDAETTAQEADTNDDALLADEAFVDPEFSADESVISAAATTTTLLPTRYTTTSGSDGGQPVSNLHVQDQAGTQSDTNKFVALLTPSNKNYIGYRSYSLPTNLDPATISALQVKANYRGPAKSYQTWTWTIYNWSTQKWVTLGNNSGAQDGQWKLFTFTAGGTLRNYINSSTREIQVRLQSNNTKGDMALDYEALAIGANNNNSLPISGVAVPALSAFDNAMVNFMTARNIQAGTLAVSRNGTMLLERGYGWQDRTRQRTITPNTFMRIASVDKPLTAAAIKRLIAQGRLSASTKIFAFLNVTPPAGRTADPRLKDITIQHLLDHQGGWDPTKSFDPMFDVVRIANELGIASPAGIPDIARYMAGQPLQYTPGTGSAYSNFGYALLRWTITRVTGKALVSYFQSEFGLDVERSYAFAKDRNAREIWYSDPGTCTNVYQPSTTVACPDGGFAVEAYTLVASSATLATHLNRYWISGEPRAVGQTGYVYWFFGSLPGTFTFIYQHPNGTNVAILFNQRTDPSGLAYDSIKTVIDQVIAGIPSLNQ